MSRFAEAVLLIFVATSVQAGASVEPVGEKDGDGEKSSTARPPRAYLLRCWQHGRLLFEEEIAEPPEANAQVRMRLAEPARATVTLIETGTGLCSVRPSGKSVPKD
ncbi:MAG TPA: hypothetical protein VLW55_07535 [Burkholderiaceae bacterium]|nr:hypothetical protein [Burkholderiaceae bacterium]